MSNYFLGRIKNETHVTFFATGLRQVSQLFKKRMALILRINLLKIN